MLSIFIFLILAMTLVAAIGYAIVTMTMTAEVSLGVHKNQIRMATAASFVRSYVRIEGGDLLIPMEADFEARVPSFSPYATTVWGKDIIYCPVSPKDAADPGKVTVTNGDETFDVNYETVGSVTYVTAGAPAFDDPAVLETLRKNGIIALLIAPGPNSDGDLKCGNVEIADDGITVLIDDGSVTTVADIPAESDGKTFILGGGDGSNPALAINDIADVTSYVRAYGTRDLEILIPRNADGDPVYVDADDLDALLDAMDGRTLRLTGDEEEGSILGVVFPVGNESDREWSFTVKGRLLTSDLTFYGYEYETADDEPAWTRAIDVGAMVSSGGTFEADETGIAHLDLSGGDAVLKTGTRIKPEYGTSNYEVPIHVSGGRLSVDVQDTSSEPLIDAVTSSTTILVEGGTAEFLNGFHAKVGVGTERLMLATDGGRISRSGPSVKATVTRASVTEDEDIQVLPDVVLASETCDDDSETCSVICDAVQISPSDAAKETYVSWGECASADGAAVSGTAMAADRQSFTCAWQLPASVVNPTARAYCAFK